MLKEIFIQAFLNFLFIFSFHCLQVSLEYLSAAAGLVEESEDLDGSASSNSSPLSTSIGSIASFQQREQCLASVGLDIHSCLHFLLDLYSQWLSTQSCPVTPLTLLTEVAKSVRIFSYFFFVFYDMFSLQDLMMKI